MVHGSGPGAPPAFENAAECPDGSIAAIASVPARPTRPVLPDDPPPTVRDVLRTWTPLAASWLLMGLEVPLVSAGMARMPMPTLSLAAYGGVVFPLALLIESPIIMLLSASTALSKDLASHRLVGRFMWTAGLAFTALHALVAFTPLFDVVVGGILGAPEPIREPARLGLMIMTPWTISIAFRRYSQGLLIRFGRARLVGAGTAVRLTALVSVLAAGVAYGKLPGIAVGALAVTAGVVSEALFAGRCARPVERVLLAEEPPVTPPLTQRRFLAFYVPLMLTPLIAFLAMPLSSAAISRMPRALESLAVWPALTGIVFTLRSVGFALNEVVVSMLETPGALPALRRFTRILSAVTSGVLLVFAVTPLGHAWFAHVANLPAALVALTGLGLALAVPMPALSAIQSLHQGRLVHAHKTRGVTESVVVLLVSTMIVLAAGVALGRFTGLYVGLVAFVVGNAAQAGWLMLRARGSDGARPAAAAVALACVIALAGCGGSGAPRASAPADTVAYEVRALHRTTADCVTKGEPCLTLDLVYPVLTRVPGGDTLALNRELRRRLNSGMLGPEPARFGDPDSILGARIAAFEQPTPNGAPWFERTRARVVSFRPRAITIAIASESYMGGAHGNSYLVYANFDPADAQAIPLDSVLAPGAKDSLLAAAERAFRRARGMAADSSFQEAGFWFEGGRFTLSANYGLTPAGLAFRYDSYDVAPYAWGPTDAVVPWAEAAPLLRAAYRP